MKLARPRLGTFRKLFLTLAATSALAATPSQAQDYPNKPLRLVVPFSVGGVTDLLGRIVADDLSRQLGQPVIVENKAGAAGAIGHDAVAKAAPDGYTLCFCTTGPQVVLQYLTKLPFDPVTDLVPVIHVHNVPNVLLARPDLEANTIPELIELAKKKPGELTYGSAGHGGPNHLTGEMFQHRTGTKLINVNYKGESPAFMDAAGGQIDMALGSVGMAKPLIESGKLKALAMTGAERSPALPDVPTIAETLPGFGAYTFVGINVPAGTPAPVIARLNQALNSTLQNPDVQQKMREQAVDPVGGTPEQYAKFLQTEREKWAEVIRQANITLQ